jgi:hypothetical protein
MEPGLQQPDIGFLLGREPKLMPIFLDLGSQIVGQAEQFLRRHASDMADIGAIDKGAADSYHSYISYQGTRPMNLFNRDRSRARQDAAAPLAPVAQVEFRTSHPGRELDVPLSISLTAVRKCTGDHTLLRRSDDEVVEIVLSRLVAGRQLTARGLAKVRADLRDALMEAGLV